MTLGGMESVTLRGMSEAILCAHEKRKPILPFPIALLRIAASLTEFVSRACGRKISWISHQSVDGLVYDAGLESEVK